MKRPLSNIATGISLTLALATALAWVRSPWRHDDLYASLSPTWHVGVYTDAGRAVFWADHVTARVPHDPPPARGIHFSSAPRQFHRGASDADHGRPDFRLAPPAFLWSRFQLVTDSNLFLDDGVGNQWLLTIPLPAIILSLLLLPFLGSLRLQRSRARRHRGLCPSCGYDVRASPSRCPECGTDGPSRNPAAPALHSTPIHGESS